MASCKCTKTVVQEVRQSLLTYELELFLIMKGITSFEQVVEIATQAAKANNLEYVVMELEDGTYSFQENVNHWFKEGDIDIVGNKIIKIVR